MTSLTATRSLRAALLSSCEAAALVSSVSSGGYTRVGMTSCAFLLGVSELYSKNISRYISHVEVFAVFVHVADVPLFLNAWKQFGPHVVGAILKPQVPKGERTDTRGQPCLVPKF